MRTFKTKAKEVLAVSSRYATFGIWELVFVVKIDARRFEEAVPAGGGIECNLLLQQI